MPAPGDQHNATGKLAQNPFEAITPQVSSYTAQEIATLQSRLEKQLGPEYISSRSGPSNQKVHYLAAEKSIQLANEVFGFNGWSSQIMDVQVDFVDENPTTLKVSLGLSVIVRVTLRDGTFHEDIGYGHMENAKGKAAAFEKAKKEGTTDGLKRALKNFGNVLGNCLYDKDYVKNVTKMKVGSSKFEPDRLYRHATYAVQPKREVDVKPSPVLEEKSQVMAGNVNLLSEDTLDDEFGDFDEADFSVADPDCNPDEVIVPEPAVAASHHLNTRNGVAVSNDGRAFQSRPQLNPPQSRPAPGRSTGPLTNNNPPQPQTPNSGFSRSSSGAAQHLRSAPEVNAQSRPMPPPNPIAGRVLNQPSRNGPPSAPPSPAHLNKSSSNESDIPSLPPQGQGFFSARAATMLPEGSISTTESGGPPSAIPAHLPVFNPHAESPSIRKTPGVDHKSSKPLTRDLKHVPGSSQAVAAPGATAGGGAGGPRSNIMNPQLDNARRIGAPGSSSPMNHNRSSYKPPTFAGGKRPVDMRAPLVDLPPNGALTGEGGGDAKRQRLNG
ncbi:related to Double Strand Break repair protein mus-11 [Rhynchosporium graminicola]|uniref:RAD52 homolog n=1 Tax=Rhynchosporium graminicola TaxID=2792576 RepID=A0A1E1LFE3_9HELO|nr:related to Double Strand Break repair protein mus-11 [Rhynchosporium commune]